MKCKSANKKFVTKLAQQIAHYSYLLAHMEPFCFLAIWNFIPAHDKNIVRQEMRVRKREGEEEDVEEIKAGERRTEGGRIEMGRQAGRQQAGDRIEATFFAPDVCGRAAFVSERAASQPQL